MEPGFKPLGRPIVDDDLRRWWTESATILGPEDDASRLWIVAFEIVANALGVDWLRRYVISRQEPGLMTYPLPAEAKGRFATRFLDLAEMLFNLQCVPGTDQKLAELSRDGVEAMVTELEGARHAIRLGWGVSFVQRIGTKGADYDLDIVTPRGTRVAFEIKCRLTNVEASASSIVDALTKARKQLPKDRAGVVFVRIPESWIATTQGLATVRAGLEQAFRNSERLSAAVLLWEVLGTLENRSTRKVMVRAELNPRARQKLPEISDFGGPGLRSKWRRLGEIVGSNAITILEPSRGSFRSQLTCEIPPHAVFSASDAFRDLYFSMGWTIEGVSKTLKDSDALTHILPPDTDKSFAIAVRRNVRSNDWSFLAIAVAFGIGDNFVFQHRVQLVVRLRCERTKPERASAPSRCSTNTPSTAWVWKCGF